MTLQEFNHRMISLNENLQFYALSLTANQDDADDLLQDTYLKAISNRDKFDPSTNMKAWTYTIMRNTFINNYRKSRRVNTVMDDSQEMYYVNSNQKDVSIDPEASYNQAEIMKAICSLDYEQRIPFERHLAGYKYKEIADEMQLPIGTVKSRIFLTRQKLAEQLKDFRN